MIFIIFGFCLIFIKFSEGCAPPYSIGTNSDYSGQRFASGVAAAPPNNMIKLLGDLTHANSNGGGPIILDGKPTPSIKDPVDLFCYDFDEKCRWKNMEGIMIDELDWFQGSGILDEEKLRIATGTQQLPDGSYGIVATDKVQPSMAKAVLISDIIECQTGPAEVRFMYWTSPGVVIHVCTKLTDHIYPNYDYCARPVEDRDPGPVSISIPDLDRKPFQIFIRAENFILESEKIQGGFAIIDSIEYFGDLCSKGNGYFNNGESDFVPLMSPFRDSDDRNLSTSNSLEQDQLLPLEHKASPIHVTTPPLEFVTLIAKQKLRTTSTSLPFTTEKTKFTPINAGVCSALNCTFSFGECLNYFDSSPDWQLSNAPIGNPATGIRGDASLLPFNRDGSFAFVEGPKQYSRFKTGAFEVEKDIYFMFAYYKVSHSAEFRVIIKREDERGEQVIFEAPRTTIESRRWFREIRKLEVGRYNYITFEVRNLPSNAYIGIDEFLILNESQQPFCSVIPESRFIESFVDPTIRH
uniref:MAM domain-containing protein n=1 Tax=Panagrolaimus davidi TaxID=227884 RepID=A0A914Q5V2_9BILA